VRLQPLLVVLGAVALALLLALGVGVLALLLRGAAGSKQEVVGSELPPGWQPGSAGVGQVPPPPGGAPPPPPAGTAPPVPEAPPYAAAPPAPTPEGELPLEAGPTPPFGEVPADGSEGVEASFEPPRLLYLPTPEYPRMGQRFGREGTVELQVLVGTDGRVLSADPVGERMGMGFEAAARRAAFGARFAPARRDGQAVEAETRIAIRFRLQ
jgi:protein TonB